MDQIESEDLVTKNDLSKRVTFVGQKTNPYPYIKLADYIILTSDYEGFPVTYLEAITLHKRILTTIDVSDESINIGKDYATIISMDEKEMLKDVQKELSSPRKIKDIDIKKIQENAYYDVLEKYDFKITSQAYKRFYETSSMTNKYSNVLVYNTNNEIK